MAVGVFESKILQWYDQNKRDLPWRGIKDPYKIWLSEVILQQTRVNQGMPYYLAFIKRFPTVKQLASAKEQEVLKLWQGLGYYSRARNLHKAAQKVMTEYNGQFPTSYIDLLKLSGVGPYTAAAIASIASDESVAVVDGNVYRFYSRFYGITSPIDSPQGAREFKELAQRHMPAKRCGDFNQAIMEMGATVCTPQLPKCDVCPFMNSCTAYKNDLIALLPVKASKTKVSENFVYYFDVEFKQNRLLNFRKGKGIWQGLYDFYSVENAKKQSLKSLQKHISGFFGSDFIFEDTKRTYTHKLSHRTLKVHFIKIVFNKKPQLSNAENLTLVKKSEVQKYPVPRIIDLYLNEEK